MIRNKKLHFYFSTLRLPLIYPTQHISPALCWETQAAAVETARRVRGKKSDGDGESKHGADIAAAGAAVAASSSPNHLGSGFERRRGPEPGYRVQDEERHRVSAAVSEGERLEHHAQSVGL